MKKKLNKTLSFCLSSLMLTLVIVAVSPKHASAPTPTKSNGALHLMENPPW
ncbi:hypothetical protein CLPUN_32590 [Clostridium puniceum]|uniref:Uncharacterized protein n=1 Tax=Clostridium puniceum TaxID=29367 RepID=A0A1S8TCI5_9CLOT|nr:hypothetical protein [Clostridium puniceum]OOM75448.1 hypothetical protein CLPUN_32590 [Clostridium puniceum]